jgi:Cu/Ag efflux protein CusF
MNPIKIRFFVAVSALAGWMSFGVARADEPPADNPPAAEAPDTKVSQQITATAKVQKVDLDKREVTLKTDKGKDFTMNVPESVTRLENVKPGDTVKVTFYESLAVSLMKPGEEPSAEQRKSINERTPGKLPGGMTGEQVTTTATITKIDPLREEVTIENQTGQVNTIKVKDAHLRAQLKKLKVGDQVKATYTTAMATSVTSPHNM